jgi:type VI secretion system secreted protein VgrG
MSATSQYDRLLTIETPLGKDVLLVRTFNATEAISSLFHFQLDLVSENPSLPLDGIIGKPVTITLKFRDGKQRFFHGVVSRFGRSGRGSAGRDPRYAAYYAEVVPWLWFLTRTTDCRIFQNLTVPEIIKKVFQDLGFRDFREALTRQYTKWDYCVQYRESDFNFVSRMMEQEGIFYFFEHERGKHTLVLADSSEVHKPHPLQPNALFSPEGGIGEREDVVTSWQMEQELRPGKYALRDYHFEMPLKTLDVSSETTVAGNGKTKFEVYDYQGEYTQQFNKPGERLGEVEPEGEKIVKQRMQEEELSHLTVHGASSCRGFASGYRFELRSPPPGVSPGPYVFTSVQHSAGQGSGDFVSGDDSDAFYSNGFTSIPLTLPFRPQRVTPKPVVQGTQTAEVVGPAGEEIFTDKYGRIKVQFHWDREGKKDENSSCWIRVAQPWAGKRWGAMFLPRIGQEVVVAFQEGDPDQPMIIGSVYNAVQMPAYLGSGPDGKHPHDPKLSGVKSNSTKGGQGFNELRFDDTKGKEQVFIHAQRNMDVRVRANQMQTIGGDAHLTIGREEDGQKRGDYKQKVFRDKETIVGQDVKTEVKRDYYLQVDGDYIHFTTKKHYSMADQGYYFLTNQKMVLEAFTEICLKCGPSFIKLTPAGIWINGPMVYVNSGGTPSMEEPTLMLLPTDPTGADSAVSGSPSNSATNSNSRTTPDDE